MKEDHVTVIDRRQQVFADVYFRNSKVLCEVCQAENCEHVKYTLTIPKVQELLSKKGWKIEEGEITQRPH